MPLTAVSNRAAANRANAQHSTGPRTEGGKQRSSLNALRHGLTSRTALLPSEDPAAYERHVRQFHDEYQPQGPTETQLLRELIDTAWRLNRIPALEAELLARAADPTPEFDIVDAHQLLSRLSLNSQRLSRQFQKALEQLRDLQAERLPYHPAQDGFVFSNDEIETYSQRLIRLNQSRHIEHIRFHAPAVAHA
jgi:hypothetical protein